MNVADERTRGHTSSTLSITESKKIRGPNLYGSTVHQKRQDLFARVRDVELSHGRTRDLTEKVRAERGFGGVVSRLTHPLLQVS